MNQKQIDNLSTEEYSYFLAYGLPINGDNCGTNSPRFASLSSLLQTFSIDETSDCEHEERMPQRPEDVRCATPYDDE